MRFGGLNNQFSSTVTEKLTIAPKIANTTVLMISDEPMFTHTVKTVPETVPRIVPPMCELLLIS